MRLSRRSLVPIVLLLPCVAGGCVIVGGTANKAPNPTVGQQIIDLKRAEQEGAITTEEFNQARQRLLNGTPP
jgi:hypothetical protein